MWIAEEDIQSQPLFSLYSIDTRYVHMNTAALTQTRLLTTGLVRTFDVKKDAIKTDCRMSLFHKVRNGNALKMSAE